MALALETLRVQLIVLRVELERYIGLFFIGYHQIQVFTTRAAHESGLARIESQNIHISVDVLMRELVAQLLILAPARPH